MRGWKKYFSDGTTEVGTDNLVSQKRASWSKGRLDNLVKVEICHDRYTASLNGVGEYHQSDDYEVPIFSNSPTLIVRRIQKKVEPHDKYMVLLPNGPQFTVTCYSELPKNTKGKVVPIHDKINQWLTVEIDLKISEKRVRFIEGKY